MSDILGSAPLGLTPVRVSAYQHVTGFLISRDGGMFSLMHMHSVLLVRLGDMMDTWRKKHTSY